MLEDDAETAQFPDTLQFRNGHTCTFHMADGRGPTPLFKWCQILSRSGATKTKPATRITPKAAWKYTSVRPIPLMKALKGFMVPKTAPAHA